MCLNAPFTPIWHEIMCAQPKSLITTHVHRALTGSNGYPCEHSALTHSSSLLVPKFVISIRKEIKKNYFSNKENLENSVLNKSYMHHFTSMKVIILVFLAHAQFLRRRKKRKMKNTKEIACTKRKSHKWL